MEAREPFSVKGSRAISPQPHSPWHSPVPYLFGGLAAMLGLIAFALLILACSYWKLSGYLDNDGNSRERDLEAGEGGGDDAMKKPPPVPEEKILVIMAGQLKPTFIATPASSRTSSFGDSKSNDSTTSEKGEKSQEMTEMKQGTSITTTTAAGGDNMVHEENLQSHQENSDHNH